MDGSIGIMERDARGRFAPGHSGNPAGKAPGTRNRATALREAMAEGEDVAVARLLLDKALEGDLVTARFCLDRLSPKPRARTVALDLPPDLTGMPAVVATFNAAVRALAEGEITPDEAVKIGQFLQARHTVLETVQLERRLVCYDDNPPIPGERDKIQTHLPKAERADDEEADFEPEEDEREASAGSPGDDLAEGEPPAAAPGAEPSPPRPQRPRGEAAGGAALPQSDAALALRLASEMGWPKLGAGGGLAARGRAPVAKTDREAARDLLAILRGLPALPASSLADLRLRLHSTCIPAPEATSIPSPPGARPVGDSPAGVEGKGA